MQKFFRSNTPDTKQFRESREEPPEADQSRKAF